MPPQKKPKAPDVAVVISIESSPRIKKHLGKAQIAQLAIQTRILQLLESMQPECQRLKIHVSLYNTMP